MHCPERDEKSNRGSKAERCSGTVASGRLFRVPGLLPACYPGRRRRCCLQRDQYARWLLLLPLWGRCIHATPPWFRLLVSWLATSIIFVFSFFFLTCIADSLPALPFFGCKNSVIGQFITRINHVSAVNRSVCRSGRFT